MRVLLLCRYCLKSECLEDIKVIADGVSDDYYKKDEPIATIKTDSLGMP